MRPPSPPETRVCTTCLEEKPLSNFSPSKLGKYGVRSNCKPCNSKATLERHRTPAGAASKKRANRAWYEKNREQILLKTAEQRAGYRKARPEVSRASVARYRARRRNAPVNDFTEAQWQELLEEFGGGCAYCPASGIPLEQDHMLPLSRGGSHTKANIVPACPTCNRRKNARTPLEFLALGA